MRSKKIVSEVFGDEHALTPSELSHPALRGRWLGGYRKAEVDALLDRAADRLESVLDEVKKLAETNEELSRQVADRRSMEETLRQALMSSQKFSADIIESARREADAIVAEARAKVEETRLESGRLPETLAGEIAVLAAQRDRMRREMLASLDAQRRLIESLYPSEPIAASFVEVRKSDRAAELPGPRNGSGAFADISPAAADEQSGPSARPIPEEGSEP